MNPLSSFREREREQHLELLAVAEKALRQVLHAHCLDPHFRAHAERAIVHVREGSLTLTSPTQARTVEALGEDLAKVSRFLARVSAPTAIHL